MKKLILCLLFAATPAWSMYFGYDGGKVYAPNGTDSSGQPTWGVVPTRSNSDNTPSVQTVSGANVSASQWYGVFGTPVPDNSAQHQMEADARYRAEQQKKIEDEQKEKLEKDRSDLRVALRASAGKKLTEQTEQADFEEERKEETETISKKLQRRANRSKDLLALLSTQVAAVPRPIPMPNVRVPGAGIAGGGVVLAVQIINEGDSKPIADGDTEDRHKEEASQDNENHPLRQEYENEVRKLTELASDGRPLTEEKAKEAIQIRNNIKLKTRELTPPEIVQEMEKRCIEDYGNPVGPTFEFLRAKGKSLEDIMKSAAKPSGKDLEHFWKGVKK